MRISTKGRYAIRVMQELGTYYETEEPVTVKDIAKRNGISEKYLEQIVAMLAKANLVKSIRGARGGYRLTTPPDKYTIASILEASEGNLSPVECGEINGGGCEKVNSCVSVRIWRELDEAVNNVLHRIKLSDLLEWQSEQADNYVI